MGHNFYIERLKEKLKESSGFGPRTGLIGAHHHHHWPKDEEEEDVR